ncbi:MAG: ABC transporter permease subunit [Proteobacteria bacterium]|nr:ABC transporter permease subunit [Pseudomonadota bacterium]NIS70585.1 ABC transporter permease subunit [Pseudomonadota bacterium]
MRLIEVLIRRRSSLNSFRDTHAHQLRELRFILHQLRRSPLSLAGIGIILTLVCLAVFAPYIAPYPGDAFYDMHPDKKLLAPQKGHWLGTDDFGRDMLSRIVFGTRLSLMIGIYVTGLAVMVGVPLGAIAGLSGGRLDEVIMRVTDIFLSFPPLVLAMAISAALGPNLINAIIAISVTWWPWYTRIVRGQTLSLREQPFIEVARALAVSKRRIVFRHLIPNSLAPVTVQASLDVGYAILWTAALSFVGLGAKPPVAEWGLMIAIGRRYLPDSWWYATSPGLAIMITVLGFNLLGDGLRDVLDPRLRR